LRGNREIEGDFRESHKRDWKTKMEKMGERQTNLASTSSGERGSKPGGLKTPEAHIERTPSASSGLKKGLTGLSSKFKTKKGERDSKSFEIGAPTNFEQRSHVNVDFEWSENPDELFLLHEQLGEGYTPPPIIIITLCLSTTLSACKWKAYCCI
jgi:hypothetical protein